MQVLPAPDASAKRSVSNLHAHNHGKRCDTCWVVEGQRQVRVQHVLRQVRQQVAAVFIAALPVHLQRRWQLELHGKCVRRRRRQQKVCLLQLWCCPRLLSLPRQ